MESERYNRQLYAVGEDAQSQLSETRLLVVGGGGLAEEAAKNAVLMGVGVVVLHGAAPAAVERLRELNPHVAIKASEASETVAVGDCNMVLVAGESLSLAQLQQLDAQCRLARAPFVWCSARARSGCVFADFGEGHHVYDADGEAAVSGTLVGSEGGAWEAEEERHQLYRGDTVAVGDTEETRTVQQVLSARGVVLSGPAPTGAGELLRFSQIKPGKTLSQAPLSRHRDSEELKRHLAQPEAEYEAALGTLVASVAAHEVLKRGGKFSPLDQWFWHREESVPPPPLLRELPSLRLLVVGAGAIGCELVKILGQSGAACQLTLVDPDCIEQTNLSRQLLFRASDIGQNKAIVAAREVARMNPRVACRPLAVLLGPASEAALGDALYDVACVINAVDNLEARLYVDGRCKWHGVPLIDCGTQGAKGSVQVVVPGLTESYGASADPETPQVPQCTLHMFPTKPLHTVMAAADAFHGLFCSDVKQPEPGLSPEESAAAWGRALFEERFVAGIAQLLERHPPDAVVAESGLPFWSAPRRLPHELRFDEQQHGTFVRLSARLRLESLARPVAFDKDGPPHHVEWVAAYANLRAACYGIDRVTPLEARRIAGRIVPALVTVTATVAALALLQLPRVIRQPRPALESLRNWFANLALAAVYESEPVAARRRTLRKGWTVTEHDLLSARGPMSWGELIGHVEQQYGLQLQGISLGGTPLWSLFSPPSDEELFLAADVRHYLVDRLPQLAGLRSVALALTADLDPDGDVEDVDEDAELPDLKFVF